MKHLFYLGTMLVLISACSQPKPVNQSQKLAWTQHQLQISKLQDWNLNGRVGLYTKDEAWPGDLQWKQKGDQYDMRIIASLGAGSMRVYSVEGGVVLEHSSSAVPHFSATPETLLKEQFGWELPVRHLRYWMKGIPSPFAEVTGVLDLNSRGYLNNLKQAGWAISFSRYKQTAAYILPAKVLLEHEDLSIKIVIRQWTI